VTRILLPDGWKRPSGYSQGMVADGRVVAVAGQNGVHPDGTLAGTDLVAQTAQALRNIVSVLESAGASPRDVVRMTWFVVDIEEYRRSRAALGRVYREVMGEHYPAMTLVAITGLVEPGTRVEIEATAVVPR